MRISVSTPTERLVNNKKRIQSRESPKDEEICMKKREIYIYFKGFTPWVQQTTKDG